MNDFIFVVRSLEDGSWWDSRKRGAVDVIRGDVVVFEAEQDAAYFIDAERGRALTDDEFELLDAGKDLPPLDEPKTKSKKKGGRVKKAETKKTSDEVVEDAEAEANAEAQA